MLDNWLFRLSALTAVLLSAGLLAGTILVYGVNVPYWDQWEVADLVVKAFDGTLSLRDLTFQQNESRLVFPRLLFIGLAYLTGYDVRYEMWGSFCLACLIAYNVYRLGGLTLGGDRRQEVVLLFLAGLLIFSLMQWENWFWGIQLSVFVPIACVTSILSLSRIPHFPSAQSLRRAPFSQLSVHSPSLMGWCVGLLFFLCWCCRRGKNSKRSHG